MAQEKQTGPGQRDSSTYVHRHSDQQRNYLLDDRSGKSKFEDLSWRSGAPGMACAKPGNSYAEMKIDYRFSRNALGQIGPSV